MEASVATVIKSVRNQKGYSQERLAELAQINLRTIQRIERGETEARGDTLSRIANALDIAVEVLTQTHVTQPEGKVVRNGYLALMSLAGLLIFFPYMPFWGVLVPLIMWLLKKDEIADISAAGRKIINFQGTWMLMFLMIYYVFFKGMVAVVVPFKYDISSNGTNADQQVDSLPLVLYIIPVICIYVAIIIIVNTARLAQGKTAWCRPCFRFLKEA